MGGVSSVVTKYDNRTNNQNALQNFQPEVIEYSQAVVKQIKLIEKENSL